jgi:RNA polymerase sigma-70 factor (ECF subfamily)
MRGHPPDAMAELAVRRSSSSEPVEGPDLSAIYGERAEFVWLTLQRLGVREADLEDLAHDVFLIAHRKLATFDGSSRVTTWLFGICLRVAANYRRRAHVRLESPMGRAESYEGFADGKGPEELLGMREARRRLAAVLDRMDLAKRAVFVMFEIEGLACAEISSQMGVPIGTVYSRLHAARRAFADTLAQVQGSSSAHERSLTSSHAKKTKKRR